jgi:hypothetical protein
MIILIGIEIIEGEIIVIVKGIERGPETNHCFT